VARSGSAGGRPIPPFLFWPAEPLQVEAVPVVELGAFPFQQALLESDAAIAGEGVGHFTLRVDDAMPRNIGCRVEVLEYVADMSKVWPVGRCCGPNDEGSGHTLMRLHNRGT
jgi:hypothetical protein